MTHTSRGKELNLLDKDIIHNPNDKSYYDYFTETEPFIIKNLLSRDEIITITDFFFDNIIKNGTILVNTAYFLHLPYQYKVLKEILEPKIEKLFPNTYYYKDINNDTHKQSSDFILFQKRIFPPHTDSIIHIPNYVPYKDILIPLASDTKTYFYLCKQRWYGRATSFRYKKIDKALALYSNSIRYQNYKEYGIIGSTEKDIDDVDYKNYLENDWVPKSCWNGLSIDKFYDWIPGDCFAFDPSIIHGPTNYKLHSGSWKIGITIRLFKFCKNYMPDTTFSIYPQQQGFKKIDTNLDFLEYKAYIHNKLFSNQE